MDDEKYFYSYYVCLPGRPGYWQKVEKFEHIPENLRRAGPSHYRKHERELKINNCKKCGWTTTMSAMLACPRCGVLFRNGDIRESSECKDLFVVIVDHSFADRREKEIGSEKAQALRDGKVCYIENCWVAMSKMLPVVCDDVYKKGFIGRFDIESS